MHKLRIQTFEDSTQITESVFVCVDDKHYKKISRVLYHAWKERTSKDMDGFVSTKWTVVTPKKRLKKQNRRVGEIDWTDRGTV